MKYPISVTTTLKHFKAVSDVHIQNSTLYFAKYFPDYGPWSWPLISIYRPRPSISFYQSWHSNYVACLRFTVKVCYNYSFYLCKIICSYFLSIMWENKNFPGHRFETQIYIQTQIRINTIFTLATKH